MPSELIMRVGTAISAGPRSRRPAADGADGHGANKGTVGRLSMGRKPIEPGPNEKLT